MYARPLYVPNIKINGAPSGSNCYNGGTCDLVVHTTLNGTYSRWDADTYTNLNQGSQVSPRVPSAFWYGDCKGSRVALRRRRCQWRRIAFFRNRVSTGVIDFSNTTSSPAVLYLTSACANGTRGIQVAWFLHGIDLLTGADISGSRQHKSPVVRVSSTAVPLNSPCSDVAEVASSCTGHDGLPSGGYWIKFDDPCRIRNPRFSWSPIRT